MPLPSSPPSQGRSPWRLLLGAAVLAVLSFLAGRLSLDQPPRQAALASLAAREPEPEPSGGPPTRPGAPQPPPTRAGAEASPPAAPVAVAPAPRFASPALVERVRQETAEALQAQRAVIAGRCWPGTPGHPGALPRAVTFQVTFDGQGNELSRSLADESGDLPPAVQACLVNVVDVVRIQPPGLDLSVTATLELR